MRSLLYFAAVLTVWSVGPVAASAAVHEPGCGACICLYRYGVQLLSVDDVAVITAIKHQGAFHVAFATVHRGSRRPQMSAIARPKRLTTSEGGTSSRKHAEHSSAAEGGDLLKVRMPAIECATSRVGVKWMA